MDKYRRVEKPKTQEEPISESEIRITTQGKMRSYISYASNLFQEKQEKTVVLKAMGRAINKTVTIAEILKRRVPNLAQNTHIESTDITDVWEPLEEGLDRVESTRHVSSITITLSLNPLDTKSPGYQPPVPEDQVKPFTTSTERPRGILRGRGRGRGRGNRGRGRGGRGRGGAQFGDSKNETEESPAPESAKPVSNTSDGNAPTGEGVRGRGRGRGRGGRGRGRGRGRGGRGRGRGRGDSNDLNDTNTPPRMRGRGRGAPKPAEQNQ
eukprot:TRINITY_DN0_c0_g1_i1.p1 TRINITY_DN0_c0_g1~~TRINITY_DN0_c0_g1_i1.p1  ORF type:complete len:267 (-),score=83.00 TRINITY_DN0_c0_g1_i1:35-835(-)